MDGFCVVGFELIVVRGVGLCRMEWRVGRIVIRC